MLALAFFIAAQSAAPPAPLEETAPVEEAAPEEVASEAPVELGPREPPSAFMAVLGGAGGAGLGAALAVGGGLGALALASGQPDPTMFLFGAGILVISPLIATAFATAGVTALYDGGFNEYVGAAGASVAGCGAAYACASAVALVPLILLGGGSPGLSGCNNCGSLNACTGNDPCRAIDNSGKFRVRDEINGAALGAGVGFGVGGTLGFFGPVMLSFIGAPLPQMIEPIGSNPVTQGLAVGGGLRGVGGSHRRGHRRRHKLLRGPAAAARSAAREQVRAAARARPARSTRLRSKRRGARQRSAWSSTTRPRWGPLAVSLLAAPRRRA